MKTDQDKAKAILVYRTEGVLIRRIIRESARRYLLSVLLALALLSLAVYEKDISLKLFFMTGFGMYCGALLRDVGWFRRIKKDWSFTARIIDWKKVEAMASGTEAANPIEQ